MVLRLTPELLEGAYEYLRASSSLRGLKLPHHDEIGLKVTREKDSYGWMHGDQRSVDADIGISECCVGSTHMLVQVMAHEMIHLYQHRRGKETPNTKHNAEFRKIGRAVCAEHVFDFKAFV